MRNPIMSFSIILFSATRATRFSAAILDLSAPFSNAASDSSISPLGTTCTVSAKYEIKAFGFSPYRQRSSYTVGNLSLLTVRQLIRILTSWIVAVRSAAHQNPFFMDFAQENHFRGCTAKWGVRPKDKRPYYQNQGVSQQPIFEIPHAAMQRSALQAAQQQMSLFLPSGREL